MKKTVDLIKKMAQSMDDAMPSPRRPKNNAAPPASQPKPNDAVPSKNEPVPSRGKVQPGNYISASVPAVKEMQKAILGLADAAAATDVTALQGNQQGQQYGEQSRLAPNDMPESRDLSSPQDDKKEYLGGSDPFGNFIIQNYIPKDSFTGKQYLNVDVAGGKNREFHSSQPMNLRGIIDSMKRIGTPGSSGTEKSVDGIWQTRTNNALHIIVDLVSAMQNFITDMKIPVPGFTVEQLEAFKKLIPKSYTDLKGPEDIKQRAEALTPEIIAITKFFQNLKPTVFNNKELRQYIDQKTPFAKYEKRTEIPEDLRAVDQSDLAKQSLPINVSGTPTTISLTDLYSMDLFKKFVERVIGPTAGDNPETVKTILDRVSKKLNTNNDPGY